MSDYKHKNPYTAKPNACDLMPSVPSAKGWDKRAQQRSFESWLQRELAAADRDLATLVNRKASL